MNELIEQGGRGIWEDSTAMLEEGPCSAMLAGARSGSFAEEWLAGRVAHRRWATPKNDQFTLHTQILLELSTALEGFHPQPCSHRAVEDGEKWV